MIIRDYALNAVELTEPVLENAFRKEQEYLRSLEPDRLLAGFKETAGKEKKAERYPGGWEDAEIAGHTMGHYLTALAQLYRTTGAKDIFDRLEYVLEELADAQQPSGYLFATPEEIFDRVERGEQAWVPWYTMHKVLSGVLSVYQLTGIPQALDIAMRLGVWVYNRTCTWDEETRKRVLAVEYGGMNDCLYELYKETGKPEFLVAAGQFDELELFQEIAEGKDVLNDKHANTTIPKFLGALNRYLAIGDTEEFYRKAAVSFFDIVTKNHTYVTGGNSEWEHFGMPGVLGAERTNCNCETCNTYNMLKLAKRLFFVTQDKAYMDFYERTYYNAILGSQNPETGMSMYFQPMAAGYFKVFSRPYDNFWCCTGTGMENFTKLGDTVYFQGENSIYVNLFVSSILKEERLGVQISQKVELNRMNRAVYHISCEEAKHFTLCVRIPDWTGRRFAATVNDGETDYAMKKGYLCVERDWQDGDKLTIQLFPKVEVHTLPDAPYAAAFTYGPFVLCAGLGNEDERTTLTGVNVTIPTKDIPVPCRITVRNGSIAEWFLDIEHNLVKREQEMVFDLHGTKEDKTLTFIPYYRQYKERYGIYFDFDTETPKNALSPEEQVITALEPEKEKEPKKEKEGKKGNLANAFIVILLVAALLAAAGFLFRNYLKDFLEKNLPVFSPNAGTVTSAPTLLPTPSTEPLTKEYYEPDLEERLAAEVLPDGYQAALVAVDGVEYLMLKGGELTVYYQNEKTPDGKKRVILDNGSKSAVFEWEYNLKELAALCPQTGIFNSLGRKQVLFLYPEEGTQRIHIVNLNSLTEYYVRAFEEELRLLLDVNAYIPAEQGILMEAVSNGVVYTFALPATGQEFSIEQYAVKAGEQLSYEVYGKTIRFTSQVMVQDLYLGRASGTLVYQDSIYQLEDLRFYAYAEDTYGDMDGTTVITPVGEAEAKAERIAVVGDSGENLLIAVKSTLPANPYPQESFVKEDGEYRYVQNGETKSVKGIDVSKYQGEIDWEAVAADGVEFAMLRLGFRGMGTDGTCELDPYFQANIEGATKAGVKVGVYFFTQARTTEEAIEEAEFVIEHLKGYQVDYPVVYDTEAITSYKAARANSLPKADRTDCALAFLKTIEEAGYHPMLYANTRWLILKLELERLTEYDLWYAYYGDEIYYPYRFTMWQYTHSGKVNGIEGEVDLNIHILSE